MNQVELGAQLRQIEDTGLIHQALGQPDLAYLFKHELVQDAVYHSLLKRDRRELHRATGEVLERLAGNRLEENAATLGHHFHEAGDAVRACKYYRLAGDHARRQYAIPEALLHYTRAIELAAGDDAMLGAALPSLYRLRGLVYESQGIFASARADHELALRKARELGDAQAEWRSLLDLGMLWAGQDYVRTGEYYQQAFAQATAMGSDANLAHALNHLGNWHVNLNRPGEGIRFHLQALEIFERLQDEASMAASLDFLGMASCLATNLAAGKRYYQRAIALFRRLGDLTGLSSSLATMPFASAIVFVESCSPAAGMPEVLGCALEAVQVAREAHRRDAEAYALCTLSECHGCLGDYKQAWDAATAALTIAREIDHRQWLCLAHQVLGHLLARLTQMDRARQHLEQARLLAEELGSINFDLAIAGSMLSLQVAGGELASAQALLDGIPKAHLQVESIGQCSVLEGWAELALAQARPHQALEIIDRLDQTRNQPGPALRVSWRVAYLRGQALMQLMQPEAAEVALQAAYGEALAQAIRPAQQLILLALAQLRQQQGRGADSDARRFRADADRLEQELAFQPPE